MKSIYEGIYENLTVYRKVYMKTRWQLIRESKDVKKATYLPPRIDLTMSDLKNASTQMTIGK